MKSNWKKVIGIIMVGTLLVSTVILPQGSSATVKAKDYGISNPRVNDRVTTWDKIKFGKFYQDSYFEEQPIKWRILDIDENNNALLLSDKILDSTPYNANPGKIWETCTLRRWLNEDFLQSAFSVEEQQAIIDTEVINQYETIPNSSWSEADLKMHEYLNDGGNNTIDKVFLLSINEVTNEDYFGGAGYFGLGDDFVVRRQTIATDYARIHGAHDYWWLRSPYYHYSNASFVDIYGRLYCSTPTQDGDYYSDQKSTGIRPAIRVNLSSAKVMDAGVIDSDGNELQSDGVYNKPLFQFDYSDINNPSRTTTWDCVYFGKYNQSCSSKQDIEWRVLSVEGDDAFVISDKILYALDLAHYMDFDLRALEQYTKVQWEWSNVRSWLNYVFLFDAFDSEEREAIKFTEVYNDIRAGHIGNPVSDEKIGGDNTEDRLFLLSLTDIFNTEYGFEADDIFSSKTRKAEATEFAQKEAHVMKLDEWWLRSLNVVSNDNIDVAPIYCDDCVGYDQSCDNEYDINTYIGIRPAMHIDLSSGKWSKSGELSAKHNSYEEEDELVATPTPTSIPIPIPTPIPQVTEEPNILPSPTPIINSVNKLTPDNKKNKNLKSINILSVKYDKNAKKITGKVSVANAGVKIKVGSKAYKKASVTGKKFTLKTSKLKKNTKITIKVTKKGYNNLVKEYKVK